MSNVKQAFTDKVATVYGPWDKLMKSDKRPEILGVKAFIVTVIVLTFLLEIGIFTPIIGVILGLVAFTRAKLQDGSLKTSEVLAAETAKIEAEHAARQKDKNEG